MPSSRAEILRTVRRALSSAEAPPLPPLDGPGVGSSRDRAETFSRALEDAGGRCLRAGASGLEAALAGIPAWAAARSVYAAAPGLRRAATDDDVVARLRAEGGLDFAVLPGAFGVAENGAVWVDAGALPDRALLWLAEHLVLVVPATELVADLHGAYARLQLGAPGLGVFVAGPSKTADIEQSLVIGAQGPRSTTVILVG